MFQTRFAPSNELQGDKLYTWEKRMKIEYLNVELQELNDRLRSAFSNARALSEEEMRICRWRALEMPCPAVELSEAQKELLAGLKASIDYAREHGLGDVIGWCMAGAQGISIEEPEKERDTVAPIIAEFLQLNAPVPAKILDVASWRGRSTLPLAAKGYDVSLMDLAAVTLETGFAQAQKEGVDGKVQSLLCGSFADLDKIETDSYDVCLCLGALPYVPSPQQAEQVISQLARIASKAVIVDVISKYGLIMQLGEEYDVSSEAVEQILTTGITPPERPEHGKSVISCFSSAEFKSAAERVGLNVERIVGFEIVESIMANVPGAVSAEEAFKIEKLLQSQEEMIDCFPKLVGLFTRSGVVA